MTMQDLKHRPFAAAKILTWGQALARCRVDRNLSHRDVADRVCVGVPVVRDWEMGIAVPTRSQLGRLYGMCFWQLKHFTYLLPDEMRRAPTVKPARAEDAFVPEQATGPAPVALLSPPEPTTFPQALRLAGSSTTATLHYLGAAPGLFQPRPQST